MSQRQTVRVSVPAEVQSAEVEGEAVLLNLETGHYYRLDATGTRMWSLLTQHGQTGPALRAMLDEYDVREEDLRRDMLRLVDDLAAHGLLRVDEA